MTTTKTETERRRERLESSRAAAHQAIDTTETFIVQTSECVVRNLGPGTDRLLAGLFCSMIDLGNVVNKMSADYTERVASSLKNSKKGDLN